MPGHFLEETHCPVVAGDGMIVHPTPNDTAQPFACFRQRTVPAFAQGRLDRRERGSHSLRTRMTVNREVSSLPRLPALVREVKKIEGLRSIPH
jgi:hypothetical protein